MSLRNNWKFQHSCEQLAKAAQAKRHYHEERLGFWQGERDVAEAELRTKGVEFRNQAVTGGYQVQTVIDQQLQQRYITSESKITEHKREQEQFAAFERAFLLHPTISVELDADDIRYFGL